MGDSGANLLFLYHPFSVLSVLWDLCSIRDLTERTDFQVALENQQCKSFGNRWFASGKPTWPSVLLSCRVTAEMDVLLHEIADKQAWLKGWKWVYGI